MTESGQPGGEDVAMPMTAEAALDSAVNDLPDDLQDLEWVLREQVADMIGDEPTPERVSEARAVAIETIRRRKRAYAEAELATRSA